MEYIFCCLTSFLSRGLFALPPLLNGKWLESKGFVSFLSKLADHPIFRIEKEIMQLRRRLWILLTQFAVNWTREEELTLWWCSNQFFRLLAQWHKAITLRTAAGEADPWLKIPYCGTKLNDNLFSLIRFRLIKLFLMSLYNGLTSIISYCRAVRFHWLNKKW